MKGIKEISGLCFWMDNKKAALLKQVLDNQRPVEKTRQALLRDLEKESHPIPPFPTPLSNPRKRTNH